MPEHNFQLFFRRADNFIRGLANGLTFGVADVIAGVADTAVSGGELRAHIRDELKRTTDGGTDALAGEVAGALLSAGKVASVVTGGLRASSKIYKELMLLSNGPSREAFLAWEKANEIRNLRADAALGAAITGALSVTANTGPRLLASSLLGSQTSSKTRSDNLAP